MSVILKERKFIQCFKSTRDGSCNHCRIRAWKKGYKIYAMQNDNGKWLACTDRKCYLEQGGILTVFDGTPMYPKEEEQIQPRHTIQRKKSFLGSSLRLDGIIDLVELVSNHSLYFSEMQKKSRIIYKKSFLNYLRYCVERGFMTKKTCH